MTDAAQVVDALLARWQLRARTQGAEREAGTYPPGWTAWLAAQRPRRDAVTGDTAQHWVELLAAREVLPPPRALSGLSRWAAFATLWRQQWQPAPREERGLRALAASVSTLVHVVFAILLVWIALVQFVPLAPSTAGEEIVLIESIGRGAPEELGGGTPTPAEAAQATPIEQPRESAGTAPSAASAPPSPMLPQPSLDAPVPEVAVRDVPTPPAPQEVVVSAPAPDPTVTFTLPPPTPRITPELAPTLPARVPEVASVAIPDPLRRPAPTPRAEAALPTPVLRPQSTDIAVREVAAPVRAPAARVAPRVSTPSPVRTAQVPGVARRDIAAPTPRAPAATTSPTSSTPAAPSATPAASATSTASTPAPRGATPATSPGAGPRAQPTPGARPATTRGDDWDDARRDVAGGTRGTPSGVFNPDGSVRLADRPGSASSGLPPGSLEQEIANLDRAGTWLRRPPPDYRGSIFDNAWRPNETLLEEWVRKSVSTVYIPIPGSTKRIECKTVLLAAGGACRIVDPNLNEQPARARPPPDIPFKPHLQEDNGSVKPAG